jgi:hypothetical protein
VAVKIIKTPFFGIVQNFVSLGRFLELFFRLFVPGIAVRMVFQGELALLLLDLFRGGVPGHPQNAVVVLAVNRHIASTGFLGFSPRWEMA